MQIRSLSFEHGHGLEVTNPFDGSRVGAVPRHTRDEARRAIESAQTYDFRLGAWERYEILHNASLVIKARTEELARLITLESGKTIRDARVEIRRSVQTFLLSAEEAKRINGEMLPIDAAQGLGAGFGLVVKEPIGVIVAIAPFNYPLNLVAHKVGPALAANNAVVVKPSSQTPLTAYEMSNILLECGLPGEMLHILSGDSSEIGDELVQSPDVAKVTFTGSAGVGKAICAKMTGLKANCMELGGNDPLIILRDADISKALPIAVDGAFGNNGQRCTSTKRIIIEECIADQFIERFTELTARLQVGNPLCETTDVGPLITAEAAEQIERRVEGAIERGAVLRYGNRREGGLYWPTVLDRVSPADELVQQETFGPVAPFIRVGDFDQAIDVANQTRYGLQAGIFTNNLQQAISASRRIQAGALVVNNQPGYRAEHLPFGGVKDSGIGREGVRYAVDSMTRTKMTVIQI